MAHFPSLTHSTCPVFLDGQSGNTTQSFRAPFYFSVRKNLAGDIPDNILALVAPVATFWLLSLFFHCLDISGWKWLDRYRIHESEEVRSKNLASRSRVFWTVVGQHVVQTILGYIWLDEPDEVSVAACQRGLQLVRDEMGHLVRILPVSVQQLWDLREGELTHWLYWWALPITQMFLAMFILDTWEYFLHRLMHSNKFLYKHLHSMHHQLYVPYAYGAQYNHPLEGFIVDTCGVLMASSITCLTTRQAIFFFSMSTAKAVYDHCGYRSPLDPFGMLTANNAEYHDIHHQTIGTKYNFSQPFFTHWDTILGTRLTLQEVKDRKYRNTIKGK